jgi:hypothetical protein
MIPSRESESIEGNCHYLSGSQSGDTTQRRDIGFVQRIQFRMTLDCA